jgi:F-type H+-transporting ATPase subunit delta
VRETVVARSYAEALFELGERHDAHEEFARGFELMATLLASDPRIGMFMATPKIDAQQKQQALRTALAERVSPLFLNFVMVVVRNRRQRLLATIGEAYGELMDESRGRVRARVTLAHEADAALRATITAELERLTGKTVMPAITVDPSILGGIIVRYGDHIMDGSLRRRLLALRRRLVEATLPPRG